MNPVQNPTPLNLKSLISNRWMFSDRTLFQLLKNGLDPTLEACKPNVIGKFLICQLQVYEICHIHVLGDRKSAFLTVKKDCLATPLFSGKKYAQPTSMLTSTLNNSG